MAYSGEEIETVWKRLEAVEDAIDDLKRKDLLIAKTIGRAICTTSLNVAARTTRGGEQQSFAQHWDKKLNAVRKAIEDSQTIESVFEAIDKFDKELSAYVKATKVSNATEAMDIAHSFIKKYVPVALPMKAVKEGDVWLVDIDVGALAVKVAKVKVDARTGDVLSYEIPEK